MGDQLKSEGREFKDGEGPSVEDFDSWSGFFLCAESTSGNQVKCSFVGADGYFETSDATTRRGARRSAGEGVYFLPFFLAAFAKALAASFSFFAASFSFLRMALALSNCPM